MKKTSNFSAREWWLFIAIIVLIQFLLHMFTWFYSGDGNIVSYLSFAGTIVSIILALLAIIYSFFSNASFQQTIGYLSDASKDISLSSKTMVDIVENFEERLSLIPDAIKSVEGKIENTNLLFEQFSQSKIQTKDKPYEEAPSDKFVTSFLYESSNHGILTILSICISHEKNIPFDKEEITQNLKYLTEDYMYGYIVASACFSLFDYSMGENIIKITKCLPKLKEMVEKEITRRVEEEDSSKTFMNNLDIVSNYFSNKEDNA